MTTAVPRSRRSRIVELVAWVALVAACSEGDDDGANSEEPQERPFWGPVYMDEEFVLAAREGRLGLTRPEEPAWIWTAEVSGTPRRAVRSGAHFVVGGGGDEPFVSAHDATSGAVAWEGAVPASPRLSISDRWVAATWSRGARVFNPQTGDVVATLKRPGNGSATHLEDERIILCGLEGIAAYELPSGELAWRREGARGCTVQGDYILIRSAERNDRPMRYALADGSAQPLEIGPETGPDAKPALVAAATLDETSPPRTYSHSLVIASPEPRRLMVSLFDDAWTESWSQPVYATASRPPPERSPSEPWPESVAVHRHLEIVVSGEEDGGGARPAAISLPEHILVFDWRTGELLQRRLLASKERPQAIRGARLLTVAPEPDSGVRTLRMRKLPGLDEAWRLRLGHDGAKQAPLVYWSTTNAFIAAEHQDGVEILLLDETGDEQWRLVLEGAHVQRHRDIGSVTYASPVKGQVLVTERFAAWAGPDGALNLLDLKSASLRTLE